MPTNLEITCVRCGHTWSVDLDKLDRADQTVYRGKRVVRREYRVRCPNDGTWNRLTVEIQEEGGDGQGTPG